MLRPTEDRVDYGAVLAPPDGFRLVRAVATTYSLDFPTLIAALIPLGLGGSVDDREMQNPIALLQAIRKVTDKLVVFCEAGQIKAPGAPNRLLSLIDEIVVPVAMPKRGKSFPSFHPKTWTIEYENTEKKHVWRFVVLSRNLTSDQSWDVSLAFDGEHGKGTVPKTQGITTFLEFLRGRVLKNSGTDRQKKVVEKLIHSLPGVSFACDAPFDDFAIYPFGIKQPEPDVLHSEEIMDDRVIISPFLSEKTMRRLNDSSKEHSEKTRILISRAESFEKIAPSAVSNFRKFILREAKDENGAPHDLHAKVYLSRRGGMSELWLGSANATERGFGFNVEMMVKLVCANRHLNAEKLLTDICGGTLGTSSPLEEVVEIDSIKAEADPEEQARMRAEDLIREVCHLGLKARVRCEAGQYRQSVFVAAGSIPDGIRLWPINSPESAMPLDRTVEFPLPVPLADISELYVVSVDYGSGHSIDRVIRIRTEGMEDLRDARCEAVLNDIVRDRPALLRYLLMLLSSNPALPLKRLGELERGVNGESASRETAAHLLPGLYEEMLAAAAEDPQRIREAGFVLGRMGGDDAVLAEYRRLYRPFAEALKLAKPEEVARG